MAIHGYFLAALLVMGLADDLPVLLVVAVILLLAELPLALLARRRHAEHAGHVTSSGHETSGSPASATASR